MSSPLFMVSLQNGHNLFYTVFKKYSLTIGQNHDFY